MMTRPEVTVIQCYSFLNVFLTAVLYAVILVRKGIISCGKNGYFTIHETVSKK
jgi:hypothetical protein